MTTEFRSMFGQNDIPENWMTWILGALVAAIVAVWGAFVAGVKWVLSREAKRQDETVKQHSAEIAEMRANYTVERDQTRVEIDKLHRDVEECRQDREDLRGEVIGLRTRIEFLEPKQ